MSAWVQAVQQISSREFLGLPFHRVIFVLSLTSILMHLSRIALVDWQGTAVFDKFVVPTSPVSVTLYNFNLAFLVRLAKGFFISFEY
jgi:hypothetical protein